MSITGADYGIFANTSEYSAPAVALANRHGIKLLDGQEISRIINKLQRDEPQSSVEAEVAADLALPQTATGDSADSVALG